MKPFKMAFALCLSAMAMTAQAGYSINGYHHPPREPKGLYIVNFDIFGGGVGTDYYDSLTYRVYCPTKMVREITNGKMGTSRTAAQEDKVSFGGEAVMRGVVKKICR